MNKEELIARLILSTRRKNRQFSVTEVANNLLELIHIIKNIDEVGETIGLKRDMINRILSVLKLNKEVQKLFSEKKINSYFVAYYLKSFNNKEQLIIANEVVNNGLTSTDVRALSPLRKSFPSLSIDDLINKVKKSKKIKVYVAYFQITQDKFDKTKFIDNLCKNIGVENFISIETKGFLGILKITEEGKKKLNIISKNKNTTVSQIINQLIS